TYIHPATGGDTNCFDNAVEQPDGKIIVLDTGSSTSHDSLIRLNSNGTIDTGFGTNGVVTRDSGSVIQSGLAFALQPDGKVLHAGSWKVIGNVYNRIWIRRYNANGTLDNTFGTGGEAL